MTRMEMLLSYDNIAILESVNYGPCLSLYQETHRSSPDNKQDQIRFHNLVKILKESLHEKYPEALSQDLIEPFELLQNDYEFWKNSKEGLGVLVGAGHFDFFRLQRPVYEYAATDDCFFLGPLRRYLQSVDRFQILGLSLDKIQLFEGNRNTLDEISTLPGVPITSHSVLGVNRIGKEQSVSSHFGIGHGTIPAHHSYGDKQNNTDIDAEKFFRSVDRAIIEYHSRPSGLPLVLACLPEHQELFHKISSNPFLLKDGITTNPEVLTLNELKERAWQLFEPQYERSLSIMVDEFIAAKAKGLGNDNSTQISQAAAEGRVATLLLSSDEKGDTGSVNSFEGLTELVGKKGGKVYIIPSSRMPAQTGVAASYRY